MLPLLPVRVALPCSFHPQQVRCRSCGNRLTGALPKCPVMWQACFGTPRPFLFEPALCVVPVLNSKCNEPQCRWNFPIKYPPCKTADQVNRSGERSPRYAQRKPHDKALYKIDQHFLSQLLAALPRSPSAFQRSAFCFFLKKAERPPPYVHE